MFKDGVLDGKGELIQKDKGLIYKGDFKNDMMHGHGVLEYADGSIYSG
jgi:hypothetical protein